MNRINGKHEEQSPRRSRRFLSVLLAATLILALSVTAYATGLFGMRVRKAEPGEEVKGMWIWRNEDGSVTEQPMEYPEAGFVFTGEGEIAPEQVEFRLGWTPDVAKGVQFTQYYDCAESADGDSRKLPYIVSVHYNIPGFTLVLNGDCELVKEEDWEEFHVLEITAVWNPEFMDEQHYVLLFNDEDGYMICVGGTDSYETLERIAQTLEIRKTGQPVEADPDFNIGILNIGRG